MALDPDEPPPSRLRWSSKTTWIGALAVVLALGFAALTSVSSQRMIRDMDEDLRARIASYSGLASARLGRVIAEDDRDTARRILKPFTADPDVVAVTLRGDLGAELYRYGTPGAWLTSPDDRVEAGTVLEIGDRLATEVPVPSTGRRGTLRLELSTARLRTHRRIAGWAAISAGISALLFAVITRRLIARSVVRRLHAIVEIEAEAERDPGAPPVPEQSHDEIAIFGGAFHRMLARLRNDQLRLHATVSELTVVQDELARTNRELEQRVEQRTAELRDANHQLQVEMTSRSQIEVELRQAQKLESVGRLASGIAHEINTPVQFVGDSCSFLETSTADLIAVIAAYRTAVNELEAKAIAPASAAARMRGVEAERDLGYLIEQVPLAVRRALQGVERVSAIVRAMKEFAHPDRKEQAPADLNRAILSTLTVARNEYKYVAEVRTELGDLPLVTCHIGELNQVVLNMIVNAAHAIASANEQRPRDGLIVVRTRPCGDEVAIEIEDNGCGIPAELFDKIFDPFFTTKEIGKGTGQGLAIAHSVIVDKHAGKIDVASQVGQGTTFTITLPVVGRGDSAPDPGVAGQSIAISDDSIDRGPGPPTGHDRETA